MSIPPEHAAVLAELGATGTPLGTGGEATVYVLDDERVVRIMHSGTPSARLEAAYRRWQASAPDIGVELPTLLATGRTGSRHWEIQHRIPGVEVSALLRELDPTDRAALLGEFLDVATRLGRIETAPTFSTMLGDTRYDTWAECLMSRIGVSRTGYPAAWMAFGARVPELAELLATWRDRLTGLYDGPARLVHVDYFPGNVLADLGADGRPRITGVLDYGSHSLYVDPLLDVVGAVAMTDMLSDVTPDEATAVATRARSLVGPRWDEVESMYRAFYAFYYAMDEALLDWSERQLRLALG